MKKNYTPKQISKPEKGRRIAIGDIHGCYDTFKKLLDTQLNITQYDQIFLLGDLIDRGQNSALVLDLILELQQKGFNIYPIMGNHEEKLLLAFNCGLDFFENYLEEYNSLDLLDGDIETYLTFINGFDYCIELDDFVLSHSGINEKRISPFTDLRGMFPNVIFNFEEADLTSKIQVHGHAARTIEAIQNSICDKERRFSIDSGCYFEGTELGYLTALDLDSMVLFHQKNF